MAFNRKKFMITFADEAKEHIVRLNEGFLTLEKGCEDSETLNQVFRSAHTIKGSSSLLGLTEISDVAHKLEDALEALRDRKIQLSKELFNLLFNAVDTLMEMTDLVKEGSAITTDVNVVCQNLERVAKGESLSPTSHRSEKKIRNVEPKDGWGKKEGIEKLHSEPKVSNAVVDKPSPEFGETAKTSGKKPEKQKKVESFRIQLSNLDRTIKLAGEVSALQTLLKKNLDELEEIESLFRNFVQTRDQSGKISENRKGLFDEKEEQKNFRELTKRFKRLKANSKDFLNIFHYSTNDLRETALKMRMVPISTVLSSFPRMVRDLCASSQKDVELIIEGGDTQLDRKISEQIGDPLLHSIRNCFDHGIECPEERMKAGKPEKGMIRISAAYEGSHVLIEVSDDGRGIPIELIKEKAFKKKIHDWNTLNSMSYAELVNLIFLPGFSTSSIITDISGRGVGMDVVKENIVEQLKGSVDMRSETGIGTTFFIRIPSTLAVVSALFFRVNDQTLAIPVTSIDEILKISEAEIIEVVNKKAIRHKEQLIPLFVLARGLGIPGREKEISDQIPILIVSYHNERLGLRVTDLIGEEEIEIVSLPDHMKSNELIAGCALYGKEEVVMLLHLPKLFAIAKEKESPLRQKTQKIDADKTPHILVVDDSVNTREIEKSIMESYGYKVDLASDGLDGLLKAQTYNYDLIVTDIEMPHLDGFSLTEKLRKEKDYEHTPIIIVTSRDKKEDKRRGIKVGADAYIVKGSFDQSNLLSTVQSLIG